MNLEELKIKISIELKELDKQLNSISKSIDKTLGSKATKKLMQSNHKVIKAESKLINKTLNDAFEVDFTKFNNGLAKTMNQAKRTVKQTCREIRNELNNALNGSGSITVTGKASVSRTPSSQNSANNAAIVQSSQYVGAMITKAVNEMIKANNANTGRIETALKEVINAIGKLSINNNKQKNLRESDNTAQGKGGQTKTTNTVELIFDVKDSELQNEVDQAINRINVPNLEIPIDVDTSDIDKKIDVSNVSTVVSLEVDIDDSELQSKVEKAKNKISVPDVRIGTMLDDRNNLQNEVNKLVRETNVPELKFSIASIDEEEDKLQSTLYHMTKDIDIPALEVSFAPINVRDLQEKINEAISKVKVPQLQVEAPEVITTAKEASETTSIIDDEETKRLDTLTNSLDFFMEKYDKLMEDLSNYKISDSGAIKVAEYLVKEFEAVSEKLQKLMSKATKDDTIYKAAYKKDIADEYTDALKDELPGLREKTQQETQRGPKPQRPSCYEGVEIVELEVKDDDLQEKINEAVKNIKVPEIEIDTDIKRKPTLKDKAPYDNEITVDTRPVESFDFNYNESQIEKYCKMIEQSRSELRGLRDSLIDIKESDMGLIDKAKELEKLEELSKKMGKALGRSFAQINMVQSNLPDIDLSEQVEEFMKFTHVLDAITKSLQKYKKEVEEQIDANLPPNGPGAPGSLESRKKGKGPDELAMTLDDSINEGLEALLNTIYTCLKTISVDVKAIKSMISKTAPKAPTKPTEVSSPVKSKEASPIKQISEAKSSEDVQLEKPIIELDEESLRKELEEKLQKSFDFIAEKDIGKGLDVYRKSREMGIVADAPINMNDLAEIGKYIEDLKNKIMSSNLNKAFDINVKDTIKKTKEKEDRNKRQNEINNHFGRTNEEADYMNNELRKTLSKNPQKSDSKNELEKVQRNYKGIKEEVEQLIDSMKILNKVSNTIDSEIMSKFIIEAINNQVKDLIKDLEKIGNPIELDIKTVDIEDTKKELKDFTKIVSDLQKQFNESRFIISDEDLDNYKRRINKAGQPTLGKKDDSEEANIEDLREKIRKSIPDIKAHLKESLEDLPDDLAITIDDSFSSAFGNKKKNDSNKPEQLTSKDLAGQELDALKQDLETIRGLGDINFEADSTGLEYVQKSLDHILQTLTEIGDLGLEDGDIVNFSDGSSFTFDSQDLSQCIEMVGELQKEISEATNAVEEDPAEIKVDIDRETMEATFKFLEHFVKQAEAKYESNPIEVPIEFALVNQGAMNLRTLMDLPQFKEDAEAISSYLKGLDLADELELDIGVDQLTDKLKKLQSMDDIDIDLEDLRRDIVLLLEKADQMRSTMDDEIIIKVVDDEVSKITDLLKLLDSIREKYHVKVDVDVDSSELSEATKKLSKLPLGGRRINSGDFSTTSGGSIGGGGRGGSGGGRVDSGTFEYRGPSNIDSIAPEINEAGNAADSFRDKLKKLWVMLNQVDAHVFTHKMGQLKDGLKDIKKSAKELVSPFKKAFDKVKEVISSFANKTKSIWSKITSIFRKGAKESTSAVNGMTLGLKDLAKTGLSLFSLYKLLDLGKQAITVSTNQAASELRLVAAMKQRMNATDDTIQSVRDLISAQSQIGVLGKDVVTMGAQQLAYYTQSAEALEALIPRMNNLLVRQEGFNASIEQAQEMAVRLGEALSENSLEPLRSADIPITDAEVETFKKLRTEEEKVAYLTALIDERVGNLNESLAQTPYGAIQQLKNNFSALLGTLGMIIVNAIQPLVQWLNVVVVACDNALKALAGLFGFSFEGAGFADSLSGGLNTGGVDSTTDSFKDAADAANEATEANEKFKGSLAGFDEINILSDNSSKSEEESGLDVPVTPGYDIPTITPTDNGAIDIMSDKLKAFIDEVLEPFKKAWELYGNDLKEEWADLKESFKNFCDSLASFLKSVWDNGGKEFVQHMAEIGLACAKAAMEIGGEILDSLARLWEHLDPSKNMHTQRLLDVLNEVSEKIRDFILGLGDHFESLMANGGQDVLNAMGDCFMDLGAAAVNGLGVAIDALDGLIDHLDPAVNENTRNMLQALADMFHAVGEAAWDFSELLKSALANGGQDMINAFGDMMMNLGETVARVITTMMESFSEFFEYIDPKNNDITENMMKSWEEAFLAIGDAALQFAELFESVMDNGGQEVLNKLGDAFNSLVGLTGTCVQEISDAMNGLFEHLDPKTNEFTQGMLKAWEEAFESISGMAKDIGEVLGSIMDNGGQDIVNAIGDLGVRIAGAFGKVTGTVADCVGELFKHLDPAENKIAKGALESFEYFIDSIGNFIDSLADALGTFMDNGGQEFVNNMADIIAIIGDFAATIGGDIINTISAFFDSWAGQLVIETVARALELVSSILKGLLEILQPLTPIISGVVTAIGGFMVAQKVGGFISTLVTVFQSLGGAGGILSLISGGFSGLWAILAANPIAATVAAIVGIGTALVAAYNKCEWFREGVDAIIEAFSGTFEAIKETCSELLENITDIFQNIIDIIVGIFTGDGERVGKALRELFGNLLELAWDLITGFVDIGVNLIDSIVKGLWEGIKLAFTAVKEIFLNLGEFIIDVFKGFFGINSPSKVFKGFGGDIVQGLIDGVTGMVSKAVKAISDLGKAILDGAKTIVKDTVAKFKEVKDGVVEKLKETREKAAEKWSEIKEDAGNYCSKLVETAQNKYSKVKDKVSGILSETAKDMSKKWEDMKKDTADKCKSIYDDVTTKFSNTKKDAINALGNIKQEVSNKWNEVKESTSNIISTMKENASQSYDKLKENLGNTISKWNESSSKTWDTIKEKTCTTASKLKDEASESYETLKSNLSNTLEKTREVSANAWDKVKSTTSEMISKLTGETSSSYDDMKEKISNKLEDVKNKTGAKWTEINNDAKSKITDIVKDASNKFGDIKNGFTNKLTDTKSALVSKWNDLKSQAYDSAKGIAEKAKSGLSNIGQTIATSITNGKSKVSSALNEIGKLFKNAKWELPKIKLPHIKVTGEWSFNPPRVPKFSIQWNKRGGIIDGITPIGFANGALQMGGEAGKEMVVPLENTSFTSKIAQAMGQAVDNAMRRSYSNNNNNNNGLSDNRDIILKVNEKELARTTISSINKLQRETGRTLLDV